MGRKSFVNCPTNPKASGKDKKRVAEVYRNYVRYPHANPNAQLSITFRNSHGEIDEDVWHILNRSGKD